MEKIINRHLHEEKVRLMKEKYKTWVHFLIAYLYRNFNRLRLANLVSWDDNSELKEGCTVILGMCSKLPYVLPANLKCLSLARWPDLKKIIIVVDAIKGSLPESFEKNIINQCPHLNIQFAYYDEKQQSLANRLTLPYVFSWLSWAIALNKCQTKVAFIHDYDALILDNALERRYKKFIESKVAIQGVSWYSTNGIIPDDKLASTFEAFIDVNWIKSFNPIKMINQVGLLCGRRVDFDTLLDIQANYTLVNKRTIVEMDFEELVHPTQMIHQYTVFRKFPGKPSGCSALTMIPFFYYFSGKKEYLKIAEKNIRDSKSKNLDLLSDGCIMNFSLLPASEVDKMLKNMVQVCLKLKIEPFKDLIDYGESLYLLSGASGKEMWSADFNAAQQEWIRLAKNS